MAQTVTQLTSGELFNGIIESSNYREAQKLPEVIQKLFMPHNQKVEKAKFLNNVSRLIMI